jgi:hypothetical protein
MKWMRCPENRLAPSALSRSATEESPGASVRNSLKAFSIAGRILLLGGGYFKLLKSGVGSGQSAVGGKGKSTFLPTAHCRLPTALSVIGRIAQGL